MLHGYGQLAEYFVRHFAPLHAADPAGTVIVAAEALSRFYLDGTGGRVGASWMTRADRLAEIADQQAYLTALLDPLRAAAPAARLTVLAFSQGTAAASRWLASRPDGLRPHQLVLWAGDYPADALPAPSLLPGLPVTLVSGDQDEYISPEKLHQQAELLRTHGAAVTTYAFAGGHTLNLPILRQLHELGQEAMQQ